MSVTTPAIVVTTIQASTVCLHELARRASGRALPLIVIGDRKGPSRLAIDSAEFVSIEAQQELPFALARRLPENHYARKNLGYLLAMSRGHDCIYETDDDNAPIDGWAVRAQTVEVRRVERRSVAPWVNVYAFYSNELIWPRGLPLPVIRRILHDDFSLESAVTHVTAPIQQGLANGSPDVDAIWRLVFDKEVVFEDFPNIVLPRGIWCPFNSQNTWWWRDAFPLLYLPSYCSFRMTDIWRSFVAQRCLWELGYELEFHRADVEQLRNEHDYMRDFDQEVIGYLRNDEIRRLLEACELRPGADFLADNLVRCYEALVRAALIDKKEMVLLSAWLDDCASIGEHETTLPAEHRSSHVVQPPSMT